MTRDIEKAVPNSDQASGDNKSSQDVMNFTSKTEKPWIKFLYDKVNNYSSISQRSNIDDLPTIFKVPNCIRSYHPKSYEPMIVSLGPYHHQFASDLTECSPSLIDNLKLYYLGRFLKRNPEHNFDDYIQMIKDQEMKVRNACSEPVMMSIDYFVRMLLLDCCFVIEAIFSIFRLIKCDNFSIEYLDEDSEAELLVNPIICTPACRYRLMMDMLLLENQLPMFLLELLYTCISDVHHLRPNFSSLMLATFAKMMPPCWSLNVDFSGEADHFLHLFHSSITSSISSMKSITSELEESGRPLSFMNFTMVRQILRYLPSATEHADTGFVFMHDRDKEEKFLCIAFERGRMKFPTLIVDEYTGTLFRNLIAFEQCHTKIVKTSNQLRHVSIGDHYFTAYASLMDRIVSDDADVRLLRDKGIIVNRLGNDEEVARLFHNLVKGTSVPLRSLYLLMVCHSLNDHWLTNFARWKWKLNYDLSRPWTKISLFAAIILFLLTGLQTAYTVASYY